MPDIATLRAAKFWVALVGGVLSSVLAVWPEAPQWLVLLSAVATALLVYTVPNKEVGDE